MSFLANLTDIQADTIVAAVRRAQEPIERRERIAVEALESKHKITEDFISNQKQINEEWNKTTQSLTASFKKVNSKLDNIAIEVNDVKSKVVDEEGIIKITNGLVKTAFMYKENEELRLKNEELKKRDDSKNIMLERGANEQTPFYKKPVIMAGGGGSIVAVIWGILEIIQLLNTTGGS